MKENTLNTFVLFSPEHLAAITVLLISLLILFSLKNVLARPLNHKLLIERIFAFSLFAMEFTYHLVLALEGTWSLSESLPLHLCNLTLLCSIILLWTGNKSFYDFVFFAGMGGALQAVITPSIIVNFPDFKFIQFFYVHIGIILTAFYLLWVKGYHPTFKGIVQTMIILNMLFPFIFVINILVQGNYMFLRMKPINGSLLDLLGPYPWYILSMEVAAFLLFLIAWLIFRKRKSKMSMNG